MARARTYNRDSNGRFAGGSGGGTSGAAAKSARKGPQRQRSKPATKRQKLAIARKAARKSAIKSRAAGIADRSALRSAVMAGRKVIGAFSRSTRGQAAWMSGYLGAAASRRRGKPVLSEAQQAKAQEARDKFGVHIARKIATPKLNDQQRAKAQLVRQRFPRTSTNPNGSRLRKSAYLSRGETLKQATRGLRLTASDKRRVAEADKAANKKYAKIDRLSIRETGKSRYGVVIRMSRSGQAARQAALRSRAAGEGAGVSFSKGLRAGERVRAQQSLSRKAAKAIGKPARLRIRAAAKAATKRPGTSQRAERSVEQRMRRSRDMRELAQGIARQPGRGRRIEQHRRAVSNYINRQKGANKTRAKKAGWWAAST